MKSVWAPTGCQNGDLCDLWIYMIFSRQLVRLFVLIIAIIIATSVVYVK